MYFPDTEMLIPSRCIFFHKTSCSPPYLTSRQACAVESAARNNRNLNVFVLFFATGQFSETSQAFVDILQTYDNVYIRRVRLSRYVIDTPLENWFLINLGEFSENHDWLYKGFHDYIRMLTLWKFGGVVLNLNSIVLTWVIAIISIIEGHKINSVMADKIETILFNISPINMLVTIIYLRNLC